MEFNQDEIKRLEKYLKDTFGNQDINLRERSKAGDSLEVLIGGEFIGVIYKDAEEDDISYDFNMAILEFDLPESA
jgi:hypothetical protein